MSLEYWRGLAETFENQRDSLKLRVSELENELRQEVARVDWLLARQYNHKTRESVDAEIFHHYNLTNP